MRYALIGCGRISVNHIKAALKNHMEIAAVCDPVLEHMEEALAKNGLAGGAEIARYRDYKTMLA